MGKVNPERSSNVGKALSIILVLAIAGAVGTLAYVISNPPAGEGFTEFYVLGSKGKAEDYPAELKLGEKGVVELGIVNHEHTEVDYWIGANVEGKEVKLWGNGEERERIGPIRLSHEQKWEGKVGFVPHEVGENQKMEFLLYRQGKPEPYLSVHLWIGVKR